MKSKTEIETKYPVRIRRSTAGVNLIDISIDITWPRGNINII
jgi:hypothetical protein